MKPKSLRKAAQKIRTKRKGRAFQKAIARIAADSAIRAECAVITKNFRFVRAMAWNRIAMKIRTVKFNIKRKNFEIGASRKIHFFPYVKARPSPTSDDPIIRVYVDKELGGEGFSYELQSGKSGTVHAEQVLEYNRDPNYLIDLCSIN
jgi:hypothetical protein